MSRSMARELLAGCCMPNDIKIGFIICFSELLKLTTVEVLKQCINIVLLLGSDLLSLNYFSRRIVHRNPFRNFYDFLLSSMQ